MAIVPKITKADIIGTYSEFEYDVPYNFLDDFLDAHEEKKARFLAAFKELFNRFTQDLANYDSENKINLTNFLLSNHRKFLDDLISDKSFLDKMDVIVDEVVNLYSPTLTSAVGESSIDKNAIISEITSICKKTIDLGTALSSSSENRILTTKISSGTVPKKSYEKNLTEHTNEIINDIRSASPSSSSVTPAERKMFKNLIFIPDKTFRRIRSNSLKTKSMISQLLGISTVTVHVADWAIRRNRIMTRSLHGFRGKMKSFSIWMNNVASKLDVGKWMKNNYPMFHWIGKQMSKNYLNALGFTAANFVGIPSTWMLTVFAWRKLGEPFLNWSRKYTKEVLKIFLKKSLLFAIPLADGTNLKKFSRSFSKKFSKISGTWKFIGGFLVGMFKVYKFLAVNIYKTTRNLVRKISNPIKRILNFFIKLLMSPWAVFGIGYLFGKLFSSLVDKLFTGNFDKTFERKVTDDMTKLEKLGSNGIFSYIQTELDTVSKIFEAIHDVFQLKRPKTDSKEGKPNVPFSSLGYKDVTDDPEIIEIKKQESKLYNFVFETSEAMQKWFFNGENSLFRVYTKQTFDLIQTHFESILTKANLEILVSKERGTFENIAKKMLDLDISKEIEDTMSSIKEFIVGAIGEGAGKVGTGAGFKVGIGLASNLSPWLRVASGVFGGIFLGGISSSLAKSYANSKISRNRTLSETEKMTEFLNDSERDHMSLTGSNVKSLLTRNLFAGSDQSSMFREEDFGKSTSDYGLAVEAERNVRNIISSSGGQRLTYYDSNERNEEIENVLEKIQKKDNENYRMIQNSFGELYGQTLYDDLKKTCYYNEDFKISRTGEIEKTPRDPLISKISSLRNPKYDWFFQDMHGVHNPNTFYLQWGDNYWKRVVPMWVRQTYNEMFYYYYDYLLIESLKQGKIPFERFIELYNNIPEKIYESFFEQVIVKPSKEIYKESRKSGSTRYAVEKIVDTMNDLFSTNIGKTKWSDPEYIFGGRSEGMDKAFAEILFPSLNNSSPTSEEINGFLNDVFNDKSIKDKYGDVDDRIMNEVRKGFSDWFVKEIKSNTGFTSAYLRDNSDKLKSSFVVIINGLLKQRGAKTLFENILERRGNLTFSEEETKFFEQMKIDAKEAVEKIKEEYQKKIEEQEKTDEVAEKVAEIKVVPKKDVQDAQKTVDDLISKYGSNSGKILAGPRITEDDPTGTSDTGSHSFGRESGSLLQKNLYDRIVEPVYLY